jgi:imidazole glycerol phosphate synthase glutamine amidotransferase subunit
MMAQSVGLIDLGSVGNVESVRRALAAAGAEVKVIRKAEEFDGVSHYVLPGVGSFHEVMESIRANGLEEPIRQAALSKPTLGICLGMQMLASLGLEFGETLGLDLIEGEVRLMQCKAPMPHIGFNSIEPINQSPLFAGIDPDAEFYFMHSYEFVNYTDVCALSSYGHHRFVAAVSKGELWGVQFHPEKSREHGIRLLKNFIEV